MNCFKYTDMTQVNARYVNYTRGIYSQEDVSEDVPLVFMHLVWQVARVFVVACFCGVFQVIINLVVDSGHVL